MSEAFEALVAREQSAKYIVQRASPLNRGFELLATAPRGVAELRALVLALAIRGLLEFQETSDQPASALLVDILTAKDRVIAGGRLRPDKLAAQLTCADQPFAVPASWVWARFGAVSINRDGERVPVSSEDRQPRAKLFDYYGASGVIDKIDGYIFDKTLLLIGEDGANLINRATPIAFLASGKYWVNNHAHVIDATHPGLMEYLCLFINAISLEPYITGTAQPKMNQAKLNSIPVALPPLTEQRRIVARVDELMKLCDALEQSGRLADEQHARLTSTLFDALAASESAHALAENWQRIAKHFDLLLDRPEAVDALEQTILQLAVRGLLLPQDVHEALGADAPASLGAADSMDSKVGGANTGLPASWRRVCLGSITRDVRYGTSAKCGYESKGSPVLRIPNLYGGRVRVSDLKFGSLSADEIKRLTLEVGDILIIRSNGSASLVGSAAVVGEEAKGFAFAGYLMRLRLREESATPSYVLLTLETADVRSQIEGPIRTTSGVKNINSTEVANITLALPPLAEQHRIVARVEELRHLCAQLRERVTGARRTQSQLADALVAEVA